MDTNRTEDSVKDVVISGVESHVHRNVLGERE